MEIFRKGQGKNYKTFSGINFYTYICGIIKKTMPTVFIIFGLRFYFYSEEHLPIHIHVENSDGKAKFNVEPEIELVYNKGLKPKDLKRAEKLVKMYRDEIIEEWEKYHGE
jgi:hypothetical protein